MELRWKSSFIVAILFLSCSTFSTSGDTVQNTSAMNGTDKSAALISASKSATIAPQSDNRNTIISDDGTSSTTTSAVTTDITLASEVTNSTATSAAQTNAPLPLLPNGDARISTWALISIGILVSIAGVLTLVSVGRFFSKRRREIDRRRLLSSVSQEGFFIGSQDGRYDQTL